MVRRFEPEAFQCIALSAGVLGDMQKVFAGVLGDMQKVSAGVLGDMQKVSAGVLGDVQKVSAGVLGDERKEEVSDVVVRDVPWEVSAGVLQAGVQR